MLQDALSPDFPVECGRSLQRESGADWKCEIPRDGEVRLARMNTLARDVIAFMAFFVERSRS